jgi:FMN phosphatase YigB (HAD superfamily)
MRLLGAEPVEAIFVDDFIENVNAARELGMVGVHFQGPEQVVAEVSRLLNAGG